MAERRFQVKLTSRAIKDLKKLRHDQAQVLSSVSRLELNPYLGEALKGVLRDTRSLHFTLKGGGQYRAIYLVDEDDSICIVFLIGTRENIYDEATRRIRKISR